VALFRIRNSSIHLYVVKLRRRSITDPRTALAADLKLVFRFAGFYDRLINTAQPTKDPTPVLPTRSLHWFPDRYLVSGLSFKQAPLFLHALNRLKYAFHGLLRESVRRVYGTPTFLEEFLRE